MATIYDIAAICGTSVATVSYVLNGNGDKRRISKETQEKVLKAAESVSYRPNSVAKRLRSEKNASLSVAVFWPEFYFEEALKAALRAIRDVTRISVEPIEVNLQFFTPDALQHRWESLSIDSYNGIVITGASTEDLAFLKSKSAASNIVVVNRTPDNLPFVTIDNTAAARMAFETLHSYAGDSILAVWEKQFHLATNKRSEVFRQTALEAGIDMNHRQIFCEGSPDAGYEAGLKFLKSNRMPKAVYCSHEGMVRGFVSALTESGVRVGEDVRILASNLGSSDDCRYCNPSVSYVNLRFQEVIEAALKMCIQLMTKKPVPQSQIILKPELVYLDSFREY